MSIAVLINTPDTALQIAAVASGKRPRLDYLVLSRRQNVTLIDQSRTRCRVLVLADYCIDRLTRAGVSLARSAVKRPSRFDAYLCMWEWTGVPLALLLGPRAATTPIIMIAHNLLSPYKRWLTKISGALKHVAKIICLADVARQAYQVYYGLRDDQLETIHYGIDDHFFTPVDVPAENVILSVGSSKRDYATLLEAVRDLDVKLWLRPASGWNPQNLLQTRNVPGNAEILPSLSFLQLRGLYSRCRFVVVPLRPSLEFTAGITTALEAAAMGKAVIASDTPGMREYVLDGETGILVKPYDAREMRRAIEYLVANPRVAARMGRRGREWVERERNLRRYVVGIESVVAYFAS